MFIMKRESNWAHLDIRTIRYSLTLGALKVELTLSWNSHQDRNVSLFTE